MRILSTILLFLYISLLSIFSNATDSLEHFLKEENIEKAIAQLFVVGYPGDIYNYTKCKDCEYLTDEIGVGGIIINQYNAPHNDLLKFDKQLAFKKISDLIKDIRHRARSSRTVFKKEPTLFVDFESYRFSSLRYPLTPPPSALALASTGDANLSYYAGILSGFQLNQLGIDAVLGPVLDLNTYKSQGQPNSSIRDRAYSDRPEIIYEHAKAFIDGLKKADMKIFIKHFPSYSFIDSNPHSSSSSYIGSHEYLAKELKLFENLSSEVDGIMTSHLNLGVSKTVLPFTFSNSQVSKYFLNNKEINSNALLITDDLSNMESVKDYMKRRNKTYGEIALKALMAGHDYLLFSHFGRKGGFDKYELSKAIKHIASKATTDRKIKERIKDSLSKILNFKEKTKTDKNTNYFNYEATDILKNSDFTNHQDFLRSVFKQGAILIKGNKDGKLPNIKELSNDRKYLLITRKSNYKKYSEFENEGSNYNLTTPPKYKNISEYQNFLIKKLSKFDLVYITVDNLDDGNAVDHIRIHYPKLLDKLVVLLHDTPANLSALFINKAPFILANFSKNPISYNVDLDFILHNEKPKNIDFLPISLNKGAFHNSQKASKAKKVNYINEMPKFYDTEKEKELDDKLKVYEDIIYDFNTKEVIPKQIVFLIFGVIWLILAILFFTKPVYDSTNEGDRLDRFKLMFRNLFNSYSTLLNSPVYLLIGSGFLSFTIYYSVWTISSIYTNKNNQIPTAVIEEIIKSREDKNSSHIVEGGIPRN